MPKFSLQSPDWTQVFTNHRKYTVSFGPDDDDKTSFKVPVFNHGPLEHALKWRMHFNELVRQKNLNAHAKFTNASLLLSGDAAIKWTEARDGIVGADPSTEVHFRNTMNRFIQKCSATTGTAEDLRDFLMNVRKPANMKFSTFQTRIQELNRYLPLLPPPLNASLDEDTLFAMFKKSVHQLGKENMSKATLKIPLGTRKVSSNITKDWKSKKTAREADAVPEAEDKAEVVEDTDNPPIDAKDEDLAKTIMSRQEEVETTTPVSDNSKDTTNLVVTATTANATAMDSNATATRENWPNQHEVHIG